MLLKMLIAFSLFAQESFLVDTKAEILLPINWTGKEQLNLKVTIGEGNRSLQTLEQWADPKTTLLEFIPKDESENEWSHILTLNKFIDSQISAIAFTKNLQKELAKESGARLLQESFLEKPSYERAGFIMSYDLKGRHEVMGCLYYSGPYDCVGVQYTIRSTDDEEAFKTIETFFQKNTTIISSTKT